MAQSRRSSQLPGELVWIVTHVDWSDGCYRHSDCRGAFASKSDALECVKVAKRRATAAFQADDRDDFDDEDCEIQEDWTNKNSHVVDPCVLIADVSSPRVIADEPDICVSTRRMSGQIFREWKGLAANATLLDLEKVIVEELPEWEDNVTFRLNTGELVDKEKHIKDHTELAISTTGPLLETRCTVVHRVVHDYGVDPNHAWIVSPRFVEPRASDQPVPTRLWVVTHMSKFNGGAFCGCLDGETTCAGVYRSKAEAEHYAKLSRSEEQTGGFAEFIADEVYSWDKYDGPELEGKPLVSCVSDKLDDREKAIFRLEVEHYDCVNDETEGPSHTWIVSAHDIQHSLSRNVQTTRARETERQSNREQATRVQEMERKRNREQSNTDHSIREGDDSQAEGDDSQAEASSCWCRLRKKSRI